MTAVIKNEWRQHESFKYFLAGAPAALSYSTLNMARLWAFDTISVRMIIQLYKRVRNPSLRYGVLWLIEIIEQL